MRRGVLLGAPLALALLALFHARNLEPTVYQALSLGVNRWLVVHAAQLILFGLMGLAIYLLVEGYSGPGATVCRVSAGVFVLFYGAFDVLAGIAPGILIKSAGDASEEELPGFEAATQAVFESARGRWFRVSQGCRGDWVVRGRDVGGYRPVAYGSPVAGFRLAGARGGSTAGIPVFVRGSSRHSGRAGGRCAGAAGRYFRAVTAAATDLSGAVGGAVDLRSSGPRRQPRLRMFLSGSILRGLVAPRPVRQGGR